MQVEVLDISPSSAWTMRSNLGLWCKASDLSICQGLLDPTSPQHTAFPWGLTPVKVDNSAPVRCRHPESSDKMAKLIVNTVTGATPSEDPAPL
ncbi:hypothetical protein HOY80DRAFT_690127 [Tuber brumale]|nr:hypothetical protein HOY80DRAFT_690127 [Tuber brumale]